MRCKANFSRKCYSSRHNLIVHNNLDKIESYSNSSTNLSRPTNRSKELEYSNNNKFHKFKYLQSEYEFQQDDDYRSLIGG
jgi:hypothetical protein